MRKLNREQSSASRPEGGISLVIAGAGTGKTSTMIRKIRNVIEHSIAKPEELLILTFSRKAAEEIRERIHSEFDNRIETGFAGTFHSFALKLLKENSTLYLKHRGITSFPSVIDSEEREKIIKQLIMENPEKFLGLPAAVVMKLSESINRLDRQTLQKLKSGPLFDEIVNIKALYDNFKKENKLIEFEDMINHAADLLETFHDLRNGVNGHFRYIFVDEFQDTSENNFRLLSLILPEENRNLFMVGDDYQSIYKFRHSRVEYIINAKKFFPDITIHKLTVNYRSHKEIISISDKFIRLNKFRTSKKIRSHNGKGGIVRYRESADMHEEAEHIAGIICSSSQGLSAAVLYRNNYQGTFLKQKFEASASGRTVEFMTMHGSKGLEFDIVIIAGISDKIIPDRTTDIEEERRLFYVALTRAKKELHLLYHKNSRGELPRFIKETGYKSS